MFDFNTLFLPHKCLCIWSFFLFTGQILVNNHLNILEVYKMNIFDTLYSGVKNKPDTPFWKEKSIKHGEFKINKDKKKWVPFDSAKRELINHIFGRNVEYSSYTCCQY